MTNKRGFYFILFSSLVFVLPSINTLDLLPDFIGYLLLYLLLSRGSELVPYLSEARSAALKLTFVTLARLPATVIMYANMYTGRDIVPLFTLVFAVTESILLYILITNAFSGLFYIAERTDASAILRKIKLARLSVTPEGIEKFTLFFALLRAVLNVLPELCLLSSQNAGLNRTMAILYPILLSVSLIISALVGIIWLIIALKYARAITNGTEIAGEVKTMAGETKLEELKIKKHTGTLTSTLTVLAASSIFTLDITLKETGGVNILPRFIYGLLLLFCAVRLFDSRHIKIALGALCALFTVLSLAMHIVTVNFYDNYTLYELLERADAQAAYLPIKVFAVLEGVALISLTVLMALGMHSFIIKNTGIEKSRDTYGKADRDRHLALTVRAYILFSLVGLIALVKIIKVFVDADVNTIFTHTGMIVTSGAPWLLWVGVGLSLCLVIYSFIYLGELRSEMRFKYGGGTEDTRRGRFE